MKKYLLLFTAAVMAAGCTKLPKVSFSGKVSGLTNGVFLVTDSANLSVAGQNLTDGVIKVDTVLEHQGYGTLTINKSGTKDYPVEVYLQEGKYTVEADAQHLDQYPKITSSSPIQTELTAYYTLQDEMAMKQYNKPMSQLTANDGDIDKLKLDVFKAFIEKYPNSTAAAHLMADVNYSNDVKAYYTIFNKLSPAAKNSSIGQGIGKRLGLMMKLLPGAEAPDIAGTTPDGKKFDRTKLDKKVYVLDIWKAGNQVSRLNHQEMVNGVARNVDGGKVGFISISLDSKRDWWTKAIQDDKLSWPQYSDLKGNESANAELWAVTKIPTYYLLDSKWHVIERDVTMTRLEFTISDYLAHHR
jgi:hypothetical protein